MKLLYLKLDESYKSIYNFDYEFRTINDDYSQFSPICFVGLNGSGKSNIIEALSEIFCFLDLYILNYEHAPKWSKLSPLSFEVEYILHLNNTYTHIKIKSPKNKLPICMLMDEGKEKVVNIDRKYLPSMVIGYSSGHNESISFSYLKNQGFYANEVGKIALSSKEGSVLDTSSLFMDYEINSLILITNYLFDNKVEIFKEQIRIESPSSFSININLEKKGCLKIELTNELFSFIKNLEKVAIIKKGNLKTQWELYFLFNDATKIGIKESFPSSIDFFTSLYKLSLLNALRLTAAERSFYIKKESRTSLKEKAPVVPKENKVFSIDNLKIKLSIPEIEIDYSGLSDGEHQFIHIFGTLMLFNKPNCLFLLDEPESHFNPQWRSKFINLVSQIIVNNNSEFILSTHSPYVVSAARKEHVLKFTREKDLITYFEPSRETFGATFEDILLELFDVNSHISTYSEEYIKNLIEEKELSKMEEAISNIANSSVKQYLYQEILSLRKMS